MLKIRTVFIVIAMLLCSVASAAVQVSIQINVPVYPELVVVPGYPVYYAPRLQANFFFYDGMYWVYEDDYWYASSWYNGPWWPVEPEAVPVFVLRIPIRYYLRPPEYFHAWRSDAPPRWGDHWGNDWEQRRNGWDRWDHHSAPTAAPLPVYQREYSGDRYPRQVEQQQELHQQKYNYQPHDPVVQQQYQKKTTSQEKPRAPTDKGPQQQDTKTSTQSAGAAARRAQLPPRDGEEVQDSTTATSQQGRHEAQDHGQPPSPGPGQREQSIQTNPAQQEKHGAPTEKGSSRQQDTQRSMPQEPAALRSHASQRESEKVRDSAPVASQRERSEAQDHGQPAQPDQGQREEQSQRREQSSRGNRDRNE